MERRRNFSGLIIVRIGLLVLVYLAFVGCAMCMLTAWICLQETLRQYNRSIETLWSHPIPKWWSGFRKN